MVQVKKILLTIPSSIIFFLIVPFISLIFGSRLDTLLEFNSLEFGLMGTIISISLLLFGGYFVIESIRTLLINGEGIPLGDILPNEQTTKLITSGIYGKTRNPMLFGYLLCHIAFGIIIDSISVSFILPGIFIILWSLWLKMQEEPTLESRFGERYKEYKKVTPYLIPRPKKKE